MAVKPQLDPSRMETEVLLDYTLRQCHRARAATRDPRSWNEIEMMLVHQGNALYALKARLVAQRPLFEPKGAYSPE